VPHAGLAQALRLVSLLVLVLQSQVLICLFISIVFIGGFESVGSWHSCVLSVLSLHEWNKVRIIRRKELTVVFIPPPGSSGSPAHHGPLGPMRTEALLSRDPAILT